MTPAASNWWERPLTVAEFDNLPEDDLTRYEVIDGTLHMSPLPLLAHQYIASQLLGIVMAYLSKHPIGEVFIAGTKVVLDEHTAVGPDLVFVANERLDTLRRDGIHGAPDLVVEITSSRPDLDRVIKFNKYQRAGVAHYWIIDPDARTVEAFEHRDGAFALACRASHSDTFESALLPGLTIELDQLWL